MYNYAQHAGLTINDNTMEYDKDVDNIRKKIYENSMTINLKKHIINQIPKISNIIRKLLKNRSKHTRIQMGNMYSMNEQTFLVKDVIWEKLKMHL